MLNDVEVLNSWKEISNYIGRGVRTVQRWEKDFGLPVRRPSGHLKSSVIAMRAEIDQWLKHCKARDMGLDAPESKNNNDARLFPAGMERLHKNATLLQERADRLKQHAEALGNQLRRTQELRDRMKNGSLAAQR
jgi:hypothetical protein